MNGKFIIRDDRKWEQIVMAELLIPDTPNVYGDITTPEAIREFAYQFAIQGYGLDVNHDQNNVMGAQLVVVESFIARPGDPDFIEGSWVIGMKILDRQLWNDVLDGKLNGFSYEAMVQMTPVNITNYSERQISGVTEPDPEDGHTHEYVVLLNALNCPVSGGTSVAEGHCHTITTHTFTDYADGHRHRYQVLLQTHGEQNG